MAHSENDMTSSAVVAGDDATATGHNNLRTDIIHAKRAQAKGVIDVFFGQDSDVPGGALLCSGLTIGNASSNATARANADMEDLFTHLWNAASNSELIIQTSAGAPTTRGASAAADFAANKAMPLPDLRGRLPLGMDNMGGSSANRVTDTDADTLGKADGAETVTLTDAEVPAQSVRINSDPGGSGSTTSKITDGTNSLSLTTANVGAGSSYTTEGGGGAHNNMPPYLAIKFIIWSGVYW
jgi:microcystin-dependent protein